jgi:hypothetical protein
MSKTADGKPKAEPQHSLNVKPEKIKLTGLFNPNDKVGLKEYSDTQRRWINPIRTRKFFVFLRTLFVII